MRTRHTGSSTASRERGGRCAPGRPALHRSGPRRRARSRSRRSGCWPRSSRAPRSSAIGRNYADHAAEMGDEAPAEPLLFLKPNTSVSDPATRSCCRARASASSTRASWPSSSAGSPRTSAERCRRLIFGYTVANDVTARDLQQRDGQWARAKGFDTFCPLGPWIDTELDRSDCAIAAGVDGEVRQDGRPPTWSTTSAIVATRRRVHPAARRRDPHRHAGRRRAGSGRPAGQRRDRGDRDARQPVRAALRPAIRTRARARAGRMRSARSAGPPGSR